MQPIKQLVSKIFWDKLEKKEAYELGIYDRIKDELFVVPFSSIVSLEGNFLQVLLNGETVQIPLHRVKVVRRLCRIVWRRAF